MYRQKEKCDFCFWKISTYKLSRRCLHLLCVSLSQREDIKADVTIFVVFASILPYASDEANQSGSERPTYHSVDIFWNGFGKQRKRSSGRAGKTARRSLYEIRLFFPLFPCFFFAVSRIRSRRYQHYAVSGVCCRSDSPHYLRRESKRERPLL